MVPAKRKRKDAVPDNYDGTTALPNTRWEAFCHHYTGDFRRNAAGAYRAAGYKPQKNVTDAACASKLLINANIKKRISYLDDQALEIVRLTTREAQERLGSIASARYSDFLDDNGNVDINKVRDPRLSGAVEYCIPTYDREGGFTGYRLKLYDPMRALELLGMTAKDEASGPVQQVLVIKA